MIRRLYGDLPREVAVLSAVAFSVALGFGFVAPAIPLFAREFGVGRAAAGAVVSVFALMRLTSALGSGRLVNRYGERVILATGIGIVAVSSVLAGLAQSYSQLLILRGIGGLGSAMFSVSAASLLIRVVRQEQRGRASSLWYSGFLFGGIAGPALGGFVTSVSIRLPFFLYAGTLAMAGTIGLLALRNTPLAERSAATGDAVLPLGAALRLPAYRAALSAQLGNAWAVLGVRSAIIPLFVVEALQRSPTWTGIGFVLVAAFDAAVLFPGGRFADRRGRRPVLLAGLVLSGSAMVLLALPPALATYLAAMVLFGLGSGLLSVAPSAMLGDVVGGRGGTVVAAYQMSGDLGVVVGPVVAGRLVDTFSYEAAFAASAAVLGLAALVALRAPETLRPAPAPLTSRVAT
jgi:MFS family permease